MFDSFYANNKTYSSLQNLSTYWKKVIFKLILLDLLFYNKFFHSHLISFSLSPPGESSGQSWDKMGYESIRTKCTYFVALVLVHGDNLLPLRRHSACQQGDEDTDLFVRVAERLLDTPGIVSGMKALVGDQRWLLGAKTWIRRVTFIRCSSCFSSFNPW